MAKWEFYDEHDEVEQEDRDPSFSFYDFKKWLDKQPENTPFKESIEETPVEDSQKELLKEEFKRRMKVKVQANIEKRMAANKKKKR